MTTTTIAPAIPADWDLDDDSTWTLRTTVDAHLGYHHTGAVMREYHEIRHEVRDYVSDALDGQDDTPVNRREAAEWWAGALGALHALDVALAEASPEEIAAAEEAINTGDDSIQQWAADLDLETAADRARRATAALEAADAS